jgi:uncharacterized membrane protein YhaH (DUF805 family)
MRNDVGGAFVGLAFLYGLAGFLPSLGVMVRRLHDVNRSGWWWLIALIPFVGAILLIVWEATDGTPGDNRFGPNPKSAPPAATVG